MTKTILFNLHGYKSPKKVMAEFYSLVSQEGAGVVSRESRFKKDREKWVACMICIGMTKLTGRAWFVKFLPHDPPDFYAAAFDSIEEKKYLLWNEVESEIVECPKWLLKDSDRIRPEDVFFEHIKKTKLSKPYPSNYVLVVYSRFACLDFDLDRLLSLFSNYKPKLSEIWGLFNIAPDQSKHLLSQLYPKRQDVEVNISELLPICK